MLRRFSIRLLGLGLFFLVPSQAAIGQESRNDKTYDEILLEVAEAVPEFAGILGGGNTLKILVTAQRPGMIEELREALDDAFGKNQFQQYTDTILLDAKYNWTQLRGWYELLGKTVWGMEGVVMGGVDDAGNRVHFGVIDPSTQAKAIKDEAERLGIPADAVLVKQSGPIEFESSDQQAAGKVAQQGPMSRWLPIGGTAFLLMLAALMLHRRGRRRRELT